MALPALREALNEVAAFPPAFRFDEAMTLVRTVHELNTMIETKGREMAVWRAKMVKHLREGMVKVEAASADLPPEVYAPLLIQLSDEALAAARDTLQAFVGSFGDRPEMVEMLQKVAGSSVDGARYLRKQIKRIDEIQTKQREAVLHTIGALRAFRSKYEIYSQDGPSGGDVATYIRDVNARYSVVNAKLAQ